MDESSVCGLGTRDGGGLRLRPEDAVPSRPVTSPPPPLTLAVQVQQLQESFENILRLRDRQFDYLRLSSRFGYSFPRE